MGVAPLCRDEPPAVNSLVRSFGSMERVRTAQAIQSVGSPATVGPGFGLGRIAKAPLSPPKKGKAKRTGIIVSWSASQPSLRFYPKQPKLTAGFWVHGYACPFFMVMPVLFCPKWFWGEIGPYLKNRVTNFCPQNTGNVRSKRETHGG